MENPSKTGPVPIFLMKKTLKLIQVISFNTSIGSVFFWFPDIIIHKILLRPDIDFTKRVLAVYIINTILCPTFAVFGFYFLGRLKNNFIQPYSRAKWQLLGIWLFGPIFIVAVNGLGIEPNQSTLELYLEALYGVAVFPIITLFGSIYDCTFFAVIFVTPILLAFGIKRGKEKEK